MPSNNPEARAHFKANAYATEDIKHNRDHIESLATCAHCWIQEYKIETPLRRCGKCKSRFYCSRQCQKADWESHKLVCKDESPTFHKLQVNFLSNTYLMHLLAIWLILEFRLLEPEARSRAVKAPLFASMCVGIEPEDIHTTVKLLVSDLTSGDGEYDLVVPDLPGGDGEDTAQPEHDITGLFQIDCIETLPEQPGGPSHLGLWRKAKGDFVDLGYSNYPVVIVQMIKGDDQTAMLVSVPLHPMAFDAVRENKPLVYYSAITGRKLERAMNADNILNMLNHHIRADTRNQLLLRTKMTDEDIRLIRDAQQHEAEPKDYVTMLREKLKRELADHLPQSWFVHS